QAGVCTGTSPKVCTALDGCHVAGTCDPQSGLCSNPAKADGTTCDDGNLCTQTDQCMGGFCVGSSPIVCQASSPCHLAGTCAPMTGVCSNPVAPDGTACPGGTCQTGSCVPSSSTSSSTSSTSGSTSSSSSGGMGGGTTASSS